MTEEDTFLRLKKLPLSEALHRYKEFGKQRIDGDDIENFWKSIGWDEIEFFKERTRFLNEDVYT